LGDEVKKNEMGGACSTCEREERYRRGFWWGNLRERDLLEDTFIDGMITLRWIFTKWVGGYELN